MEDLGALGRQRDAVAGQPVSLVIKWAGFYDPAEQVPGKEVWIYNGIQPFTGTFFTDAEAASMVSLGWIQAAHAIPRWFQWQSNFWIDGKRKELEQTLARADALLLNDSEARELSGEANIVKAIECIHALGPRVVVVKRGEYGALLSTNNRFFFSPAFPLETVKDPTGAGDSFAGGFMGYLARRGVVDDWALRQAMIAGSVMASFCVEAFGTERTANLQPEEIRERVRQFRDLTDPMPLDTMV